MPAKKDVPKLVLAKGAHAELRKGTRLIYKALVKKKTGNPKKGDLVWLIDERGKFLAQAYYNPDTPVAAQVLSLFEKEKIDEAFYKERIENAARFREETLGYADTYRWFFGESDGIPGLLVDRFGPIASTQISCPGVEAWKNKIAQILLAHEGVKTVVERNDARTRLKLGLPMQKGVMAGEKKTQTVIEESGVKFEVDALRGHKTGFYLDQHENRTLFGKYAKKGGEVLDVYAYTGGFGLHAARKGARVTMVDLKEALEQAGRNVALNGFENVQYIEGNAFDETKKMLGNPKRFDLVSCDPPAFAQKKEDFEKAKKAYHQINYNCFKLVADGGVLASSSCSHFMPTDAFLGVLLSAATNAGVDAQVMDVRGPAPDHLSNLASKKGEYLKCVFLRVYHRKGKEK